MEHFIKAKLCKSKRLMLMGFVFTALLLVLSILLCFLRGTSGMESIWVFNLGADVVAIAVCAVIYFGCMMDSNGLNENTALFSLIVVVNASALFLDECSWILQGVARFAFLNRVVNALLFANGGIVIYLFSCYVAQTLDINNQKMLFVKRVLHFLLLPDVLVKLANIFVPIYFTVDEGGFYQRGRFFGFSYVYMAIVMLVFLIDEDRLGLMIADVSGKGVPAALFMMSSKILLQNYALAGYSPAEVLEKANERICANNREEMFVTVWLGILDLRTGVLTAANAGHEYPVIHRSGQPFELFKDRHGLVVGGMEDTRYREYEIRLEAGEEIFVYTDGVPEATNHSDELYGTERMLNALNRAGNVRPQELLEAVRQDVKRFVHGAAQFDDLTMLCLRYLGAEGTPDSAVPAVPGGGDT